MAPWPPWLRLCMCGLYNVYVIEILYVNTYVFIQYWDHIFLYKNLFIRNFIYSEICRFGLPKFSKISLTFNIFVPIPVQEMFF